MSPQGAHARVLGPSRQPISIMSNTMLVQTIHALGGADIDATTVLDHIEGLSELTLDLDDELGGHKGDATRSQATRLFLPSGEAIDLCVHTLSGQVIQLSDDGQVLRLLEAWLLPWNAWPEAARSRFDACSKRLGISREGNALTLTGPREQRPLIATHLAFACCRLSDLVLDPGATGFASVGALVPRLLGDAQLEAQVLPAELAEASGKSACLWRSRIDARHWVLGLSAEFSVHSPRLVAAIEVCHSVLRPLQTADMKLTCVVDDRRIDARVPAHTVSSLTPSATLRDYPAPEICGLRALLASA